MSSELCVSAGKKYSFSGKFVVFCFLETLILRFALLPYYQRLSYYVNLKFSQVNCAGLGHDELTSEL